MPVVGIEGVVDREPGNARVAESQRDHEDDLDGREEHHDNRIHPEHQENDPVGTRNESEGVAQVHRPVEVARLPLEAKATDGTALVHAHEPAEDLAFTAFGATLAHNRPGEAWHVSHAFHCGMAGPALARSSVAPYAPQMRVWSLIEGVWRQGEDRSAGAWWFDVTGRHDGLTQLAERFALHPLAVEDCYSGLIHVPKIDDFGAYLFIVVQALVPGTTDNAFEELDVFLGPNFVITYTDRPLPELDETHTSLRKGISCRPGPDGIFHAVFDRAVDSVLPEVNTLAERIDAMQEAVVLDPGPEAHTAILEMRAHAGQLRRVLTPQLGVAQRLSRGDFSVVQAGNQIYFRDIFDHLARIDLALEAVREDADVALSTYLSALSNRLNDVMKVLSVVSALALPAVVIAGIFGTNFDNVPGLHSNWGFTVMIGSMLGIGSAMALYFHRRGWF